MKIWKIIMGCLSILIGVILMDESQSVATLGRMFGANSFTLYAGQIVSLLYIGIGVVTLAMINKKNSNVIIGTLSVIAFICSFCGPKMFEDLYFFSGWAVVCGLTALVCILKRKKAKVLQKEIVNSSEVSTESQIPTRKCPYCGSIVASNAVFCGKCGKGLDIVKHCQHCGASVNEGNAFCPNCGTKVEDQSSPSIATSEQRLCPHCSALVSNDSMFCENCGKNMSSGGSAPNMNFQPQMPYTTESDSQNKFVLPVVVGLLVLALAGGGWWYYTKNFKNNDTIQEVEDTTVVSIDSATGATVQRKESDSNPYVGKTYKGSGNGGGLYTEMTITFLDGNKCRCTSDWYQAYSDRKTLQGTYEVKNDHVIVHCSYNGVNYDFDFEVHENGHIMGFDKSDPNETGTIGLNFMTLELFD